MIIYDIRKRIALTLGFLTSGFQISSKRFMAAILLFAPSFAWFYLMNALVFEYSVGVGPPGPDWLFIGEALWLFSFACSAIIGSMISERLNRKRFLGFWIFFGVLITASFAVFEGPTFFLLLSVLAGSSFGIGFPSCLAFIADSTAVEERARVSGAAILATFIALILMRGILSPLGLIEALFITAIFRAISFFALLIDPIERTLAKKKNWVAVFTTPGFGLYFLSWLMFMAAGGTSYLVESWLPPEYEAVESLGLALMNVGVAFAGLISGLVSDRFGRKKAIIFGLSTLGISYALFGVTTHPISYLLTQIFFGASFGIIFVNYFMTVIGDFASTGPKERFYAVGGAVIILNMAIQLLSEIFRLDVPSNVVSSILSLVLFVAVIPLLYAPETLPRDKIRAMKFRKYLKKVKKVVEEEETQNHK